MLLSAIVIAKNEEMSVGRCLNSLSFADERIVIDAGSTDDTVSIAKSYGAKVFKKDWQGFGSQKNFGKDQARGEWVLFIDADEEVSVILQQEIIRAIKAAHHDFYWLKIETVFLGYPLAHLTGHNLRLFRRSAGKWTDSPVHEQVVTVMGERLALGGKASHVLKVRLLHSSHPTIASYLQTMHEYTNLDALQMKRTNRHRSGWPVRAAWWLPLYLAVRQSFKLLLYRRGILDGWAGVMWCLLSGYYEFEMGTKFLKMSRNSKFQTTTDDQM